ncbi:hypothetical protein [Halosolutus halophilus]|uniref:hypothetical protein n=1 Tax=Halosolutus halophilus TaxID=1552990 RepID=UPI002235087E|nr:hypothetical protein [Halosolutus halophilus]
MHDQRVLVTEDATFIGLNPANHLAIDNEVITIDETHLNTLVNLGEGGDFVETSLVEDGLLPTSTFVGSSSSTLPS